MTKKPKKQKTKKVNDYFNVSVHGTAVRNEETTAFDFLFYYFLLVYRILKCSVQQLSKPNSGEDYFLLLPIIPTIPYYFLLFLLGVFPSTLGWGVELLFWPPMVGFGSNQSDAFPDLPTT